MSQLELHKKIEEFLSQETKTANPQDLRALVFVNFDANDYCFSIAEPRWLDWFVKNKFFEEFFEEKLEVSPFWSPELGYLVRISHEIPEEIVRFIKKFNLDEKPNVEVIDRFLWILGLDEFPVESVVKVIPQISKQGWIKYIKTYQSGYSYQRIIEKLSSEKYDDSILEFAGAIFKIKEDNYQEEDIMFKERKFYINDLTQSGIFSRLDKISQDNKTNLLDLLLDTLKDIIGNLKSENGVFGINDRIYLSDVDFFDNFIVDESRSTSYRSDVKNFVAFVKQVSEEFMKHASLEGEEKLRDIYEKYFLILPDSHIVWRLKLFVLAQHPKVFKKELSEMMWRLFDKDGKYGEYISGAEYEKALQRVFREFSKEEKERYKEKVISYFQEQDKEHPDQGWHLRYGGDILLSIKEFLSVDEKKILKEIFKRDESENYEPEESIKEVGMAKAIHDQSVVDFSRHDIAEIIRLLQTELTPGKIQEVSKGDSFFSPRSVEGTGNALRENLKSRSTEYLSAGLAFFIEDIDVQYQYSFLRGIEEMLRDNHNFSINEWKNILAILQRIKENDFQDESVSDNWEARWSWVYGRMAEILVFINSEKLFKGELFVEYRDEILKFLYFVLHAKDPIPEDEESKYGDLFNIAINNTRGKAFQAFVNFIHRDGESLGRDVKSLYEDLLENERSLSVRFVMGYYLAGFFFRDRDWMESQFEKLFVNNQNGEYTPAWQGYTTGNLYTGLFEKLQDYYKRAIHISSTEYPDRRYERSPDEALGTHLALAFCHFDNVDWNHSLIQELFLSGDEEKQHEFISFVGRGIISRNQAGNEWFKENNVSLEKIKDLWQKILEADLKPHAYAGFGFWINQNKDIFEDKFLVQMFTETLKKSEGEINWDYGLQKKMKSFAEVDPEKTLQLIRYFLLFEGILNKHRQVPIFMVDNEIRESLEIIYKKKELKSEVKELINDLVRSGGNRFWGLKDILK